MVSRKETSKAVLAPYAQRADEVVRAALESCDDVPLYGMLRYFMGYTDETLRPVAGVAGKRIRPSLLLLIAELCGGAKSAETLAVAIELFHNCTLIHDDIEDHDTERRGRPTVWKLWGINHGINAGDAQAFITTQYLLKAAVIDAGGARAASELADHFLQVAEGQYLDFELTDKPLTDPAVTVDAYLEMTRKKTSVLVGAAAAAGGLAAGCDDATRDLLYTYGESFGMAYQIADDMSSVWGSAEETGKRVYGDIIERKKTYPVLHVRDSGVGARLIELYGSGATLSDAEVLEIVAALNGSGAYSATRVVGEQYVARAQEAARRLSLPQETKEMLCDNVDSLVRFPPQYHPAPGVASA